MDGGRDGRAMRRLTAVFMSVGFLVSACTNPGSDSTTPSGGGSSKPGGGAASGGLSASGSDSSTGDLRWHSCYGDFRCSTLRVPIDYSRPGAGTIGLAVIEHQSGFPQGTLFTNPGGPGGSGVDEVRTHAQEWAPLMNTFDVVSFDPRGSGRSEPIDCFSDAQMESYFKLAPVPATDSERRRLIAADRAYEKACSAHTGKLLDFVDGLSQARDIDRFREALGTDKISYLGFSYGTYLGAAYASRFDDHLLAAVLDGDVPPDQTPYEFVAGQASGFEQNLKLFLAECKSDAACPYRSQAGSERSVVALLKSLEQKPMAVGARTLTANEALYAFSAYMYGKAGWPLLASALAQARQGNGAALLQGFDNYMQRDASGHYGSLFDSYNATICEDHKWPANPSVYEQWASKLGRRYPVFGGEIAYAAMVCAFWKTHQGATIDLSGVRSPTLLVGATQDPATPYSDTLHLHKELRNSTVLTRTGPGHTSYSSSACIRSAVDRFLISLDLPPKGTRCPTD